ncbi:hypothetical protein [Mesorhizobium temperatum]|uniref:hypothetical protein n=1 Tax=Mesorhizobium temperatum TaxID=241416 RepID=UPI001FD9DB3F|nr:hypothetical protein [Mesorhizobium temperatum]
MALGCDAEPFLEDFADSDNFETVVLVLPDNGDMLVHPAEAVERDFLISWQRLATLER